MAQTPEGAVAFLQWWVDMYNHVELTGETQLISDNSEATCQFCTNAVRGIRPVYDAGGRIERDGPTVFANIAPRQIDENGYLILDFAATSTGTRAFDAEGALIEEFVGSESASESVAGLQWLTNRWVVTEIARTNEVPQ